jgi:hypothetical protein
MKPRVFFDNCHVFFENSNEEDKFVNVPASLYRNEDGEVTEVRFFNETYDEFLAVDREGKASFIDVNEFEQSTLTGKKKEK